MTACDPTDFDYQRGPKPASRDLRRYWAVAMGLQRVDGLEPSSYARSLAEENIAGAADLAETGDKLRMYYRKRRHAGKAVDTHEREADLVSQRIAEMLAARAFFFAPDMLSVIHRTLFQDLDPEIFHPGEYKTEALVKPEAILGGDSVLYTDPSLIERSLRFLFDKEQGFPYGLEFDDAALANIATFTAHVWQVHPFYEGNTRTVAVFVELYLDSLGFDVGNDPLEQHARYFRDALVRANYRNARAGVLPDEDPLLRFFENLLCGANHELDSQHLTCQALVDNPSLARNISIGS